MAEFEEEGLLEEYQKDSDKIYSRSGILTLVAFIELCAVMFS